MNFISNIYTEVKIQFAGIVPVFLEFNAYTSQVDSVFRANLLVRLSEYPALFTSEQNKKASSFVSVTEEGNCFE